MCGVDRLIRSDTSMSTDYKSNILGKNSAISDKDRKDVSNGSHSLPLTTVI